MDVLADAKQLATRLREAGVSEAYAWQLANGARTPSYEKAVELERKLGIVASHWSIRSAAREAEASRLARAS